MSYIACWSVSMTIPKAWMHVADAGHFFFASIESVNLPSSKAGQRTPMFSTLDGKDLSAHGENRNLKHIVSLSSSNVYCTRLRSAFVYVALQVGRPSMLPVASLKSRLNQRKQIKLYFARWLSRVSALLCVRPSEPHFKLSAHELERTQT